MHVKQMTALIRWSVGALAWVMIAPQVRAADDSQRGSSGFEPTAEVRPAGPQAQSAYPVSGSGNIIGYRPITADALEVALTGSSSQPGVVAAPSGPTRVNYGAGMPADAKGRGQGQSPLPPVYLTGILGDGPYTLGRDDVVHIDVRSQPEFSGDFVIGFDGRIQYNYLGDVPLAGLTKYEVQQVLEKLLRRYVRVPVVNVSIVAYNSKVVYVIGEVSRPGKYIMRGDAIKLREAILAAGLPTHDAALSRVHVIKPDLNNPRVRKINMKRILYKGKLKDDLDLYPGEIVVVPSTVLSKVNDFLASLLSPITRATSFAALAAL